MAAHCCPVRFQCPPNDFAWLCGRRGREWVASWDLTWIGLLTKPSISLDNLPWGDACLTALHQPCLCWCANVCSCHPWCNPSQYPAILVQSRPPLFLLDIKWAACVTCLKVTPSDSSPAVSGIAPFTIFLGWVYSIAAGHTKREFMFFFTSSCGLIDHLQVSPQTPSYSWLMQLEMQLVSLCGSHSTSHGRVHPTVSPAQLNMLQEPHSVGCHYHYQFFFCSHPPRVTLFILVWKQQAQARNLGWHMWQHLYQDWVWERKEGWQGKCTMSIPGFRMILTVVCGFSLTWLISRTVNSVMSYKPVPVILLGLPKGLLIISSFSIFYNVDSTCADSEPGSIRHLSQTDHITIQRTCHAFLPSHAKLVWLCMASPNRSPEI